MSYVLGFVTILITIAIRAESQSIISSRLVNGQAVDTLKRFPHHVTIETDRNWNGQNRLCGGSILNAQWILTSALCVDGSNQMQLHFERLYYFSRNGSFTVVVNRDKIYMHPTFYYDIALVQLPILLVFSETLQPVSISSNSVSQLKNKFAVMPGFDIQRTTTSAIPTTTETPPPTTTTTTTTTTPPPPPPPPTTTTTTTTSATDWSTDALTSTDTTSTHTAEDTPTIEISSTIESTLPSTTSSDMYTTESEDPIQSRIVSRSLPFFDQSQQLTYGMFRILPNERCKSLNTEFDDFSQVCTENWVNTNTDSNPCWDYGNGLLTGWPAKTELVGIFSVLLNDCNSSNPAVYTNVAEYLPWIDSVIAVVP